MMKKLSRRKLGVRLGPLSIMAILLVVSGVLRFFGGPTAAIAREVVDLGANETTHCVPAPDVTAVLAALSRRESRVEQREAYVSERSASLAAAKAELEQQIATLAEAERKLEATLKVAATAAEDDVARLTAVYENMKPKEAALLFETMTPAFAAGFLGRMRPEAAAKVIEGLSPDIAYSISVTLAGRNADVPKK